MESPTKANQRMVGGTHYSGIFQHWDWVDALELGYIEGCLTKYVLRWYKKDGVKDLQKALHYTQKLVELANNNGRVNLASPITKAKFLLTQKLFAEDNTPEREQDIVIKVISWDKVDDLKYISTLILDLIEVAVPFPELRG